MAAADVCLHESGPPYRPAFQASLTHGYAYRPPQIRTWIFPARVLHLPPLACSGLASRSQARSPRAVGLVWSFCS